MPCFATSPHRRLPIAGALLVATIAVALVVVLARSDGPEGGGGPTTTTSARPSAARATGPGTCAFLSVDDIRQTTGAVQANLRQTVGPNGRPGCEWDLGDPRSLVQLELSPDAAPAAGGEDVSGPWTSGLWVTATRSLYVQGSGFALLVRVSDVAPERAKEISTRVAILASIRA